MEVIGAIQLQLQRSGMGQFRGILGTFKNIFPVSGMLMLNADG